MLLTMILTSIPSKQSKAFKKRGGGWVVHRNQSELVKQLPSPARGGGKEMRAKFWGPGQAPSPDQQGGGGSPGRLSGYGGDGHYGGSAKAEDEHTLK